MPLPSFRAALAAGFAAGCALAVYALPVHAGQRYATPPPLQLGSDLASPWTLQLKPRSQHSRRAQRLARQRAKAARRARAPQRRYKPKPYARVASAPRASAYAGAALRTAQPSRATAQGSVSPELLPTIVTWNGKEKPGTLIVDTVQRRLFLIGRDGTARRYAVGVGKPGFEWAGTHRVSRKAEWPSWTPPKEMIARVKRQSGRVLPNFMPGGPENPMGARALYLGSSIYRIHGTNQAWSIGKAVSSGCIRMRNEDVMDLYERVPVGARVKVI